MQRRLFQFAVVFLWLALPLVHLQYRQVWERLPERVAAHFNAASQPNGWMSREASLHFILGMLAIVLAVSTLALLAVSWREVSLFAWALWGFFLLLIAFLISVNQAILDFNLSGAPIHPERMLVAMPVIVIALIVTYLMSHRQPPLPDGETLVVETHGGGPWSAVIFIALLGPVLAIALAPGHSLWPMIPVGVIGVFAFAMAWSGFQYRFRTHGVEVRLLGFRLRSIPRSSIVSYVIEPWAFIRGYGIRGIGRTRAYVWCNKVVHIKTSNGDVYLGHKDPERIVRDLDQMMGVVTRG